MQAECQEVGLGEVKECNPFFLPSFLPSFFFFLFFSSIWTALTAEIGVFLVFWFWIEVLSTYVSWVFFLPSYQLVAIYHPPTYFLVNRIIYLSTRGWAEKRGGGMIARSHLT